MDSCAQICHKNVTIEAKMLTFELTSSILRLYFLINYYSLINSLWFFCITTFLSVMLASGG